MDAATKAGLKAASRVVAQSSGPNRAQRRPARYRNLPKQNHITHKPTIAAMMMGRLHT